MEKCADYGAGRFRPLASPKPATGFAASHNLVILPARERELTAGLLSKGANFRLIVSGVIGVKEIEMLIKKLELDKEILADQEDDGSKAELEKPFIRRV
jgi:hypothetical protein